MDSAIDLDTVAGELYGGDLAEFVSARNAAAKAAKAEGDAELAAKIREIAEEKGIISGQLALAWVLAQGDDIVPIPGTKRVSYLEENWGATEVQLSADELERIEAELPAVAGERYDRSGMATLNH